MARRQNYDLPHIILIATSIVLFWRGAWGLMDHLIFPGDPVMSYTVSLVLGLIILIVTHTVSKILQ